MEKSGPLQEKDFTARGYFRSNCVTLMLIFIFTVGQMLFVAVQFNSLRQTCEPGPETTRVRGFRGFTGTP
jgi:hypothetical protein